MNFYRIVGFMGMLWLTTASANAETSVYELTLKGKQCKETEAQVLGCEYKVGKTLHIGIDGIGQPGTGITFLKSDIDGDFYATFGLLHGCVIVKSLTSPFIGDYAFISPHTGKVYRTWQECKAGT